MKKKFKLFILVLFVLFFVQTTQAEEFKILVLPDNIQFASTNYLVYPDTSIMLASDTINDIKKNGKIEIVSMTEIRDTLRRNARVNVLLKKVLNEFKYNYNISFLDLKVVSHAFSTNKVLLITSQTDTQSFFLRRTIWDSRNIPGSTVVDPMYKLSTYVALVDVDKETVLWQNTYYKNIGSMESRIIAKSFAPATEQLQKIKFYSMYFLSPEIARIVQEKILPPDILNPSKNQIVKASNKQTNEFLTPVLDNVAVKKKILIQNGNGLKSYGEIVNDL